jgi:hypothetical protein
MWASATGLGHVHLVGEPEYTIEVHGFEGELLYRVRNEYPVALVTTRDVEERRERRAGGPQSIGADESRTELALRLDIPSHTLVVAGLVGFPSRHIAVMRSGTDPDPEGRLAMGEHDLIGPEGAFAVAHRSGCHPGGSTAQPWWRRSVIR